MERQLEPTTNQDDWRVLQDALLTTGDPAGAAIDDVFEWGRRLRHDQFGLAAELAIYEGNWVRWIQPGATVMGEDDGLYHERPAHRVELPNGYWIGETPVTQGLWSALFSRSVVDNHDPAVPVTFISWNAARGFTHRLSERIGGVWRLPTEAEWEHACRAGTTTATWAVDFFVQRGLAHLGRVAGLDEIAWYGIDEPQPVAGKAPNPNGLYDMLGNVREWCLDHHGRPYDPDVPMPPLPGVPMVRGGSWRDDAQQIRAAARQSEIPSTQLPTLGFRIALSTSSLQAQRDADRFSRFNLPAPMDMGWYDRPNYGSGFDHPDNWPLPRPAPGVERSIDEEPALRHAAQAQILSGTPQAMGPRADDACPDEAPRPRSLRARLRALSERLGWFNRH